MLIGVEYEQCEVLLRQLSLETLKSLADTVTNKMIATDTKEDSILAILQFSNSAKELLSRKKMKKDYLFQYLYKAGVPFDPKSDKDVLIRAMNAYWEVLSSSPLSKIPDYSQKDGIQHAAGDVASSCIVISDDESQETKEGDVKAFIEDFYNHFNDMAKADNQSKLISNSLSKDCKLVVFTTVNSSPDSFNAYEGVDDVLQKLDTLAHEFNFRRDGDLKITNDGKVVNVQESGGISSHEKTGKFNQTFHLRTSAAQSYQIISCELEVHT